MMIKNFIYMIIFFDINKKEMYVYILNIFIFFLNKFILENKIYVYFCLILKLKLYMF